VCAANSPQARQTDAMAEFKHQFDGINFSKVT
jgi:hypothetical protein